MDLPEPSYVKKVSLQKKHNKLKTIKHVTKIIQTGKSKDNRYLSNYLNKPIKL